MKRIHNTIALTSLALGVGACGSASHSAKSPAGAADAAPAAPMAASEAPAADASPPPAEAASPSGAASPEALAEEAEAPPAPAAAGRSARKREAGADDDVLVAPRGAVRAGEWDDNANFREFRRYLTSQSGVGYEPVDVSIRRFLVVRDDDGEAVPSCRVSVRDQDQRSVTLTTASSGRALLFPRAEGLRGSVMTAVADCEGARERVKFTLEDDDGAIDLQLSTDRSLPERPVLDLAFVLDTTGSMSEEIAAVKETIRKVSGMLDDLGVDVRVGLVEYRDNSDDYVTRVHPMSSDVGAFARRVRDLSAGGGGDTPENANRGLSVALQQLQWSEDSVAKLAFLIADAPPHLDYPDEASYTKSMRQAGHRGIQIYTIAASGMNPLGQAVWRQIAQYTGGTNMFVLRGGAGPQSTGGGDPKRSCGGTHQNYTSGNLAGLIGSKLERAVAALDADPMRIAGLGQDERAKPCDERIVIAR